MSDMDKISKLVKDLFGDKVLFLQDGQTVDLIMEKGNTL
jgi:hypothetical protein